MSNEQQRAMWRLEQARLRLAAAEIAAREGTTFEVIRLSVEANRLQVLIDESRQSGDLGAA